MKRNNLVVSKLSSNFYVIYKVVRTDGHRTGLQNYIAVIIDKTMSFARYNPDTTEIRFYNDKDLETYSTLFAPDNASHDIIKDLFQF